MLKQLAKESKKVGLDMNTEKTKVMTNYLKKQIKVNENVIEYVDEYIYLGQIISPADSMSREIERRVCNAWKKYWSLKEVMKSKEIPIADKCEVFNRCILPVLTYGCQTWGLTAKQMNKLETCQHNMERSLLHIRKTDKIRLTTIRKRTKVKDVFTTIKTLKWKWTGHMMRNCKNKWSKTITEWYPRDSKRGRGRQYRRWEDDLKAVAGNIWRRKARDRELWRTLEEAYAGRRTDAVNNVSFV